MAVAQRTFTPRRTRCALCQEGGVELQKSHILPKFMYRQMREVNGKNSDPVVVGDGRARVTSEQTWEYMLCRECEARFQKVEGYVAPLLKPNASGRCSIQDAVVPKPGITKGLQRATCSALDTDKLAYFAGSVLWRCHESSRIDQCFLGSQYGEAFRRFLLGETAFPSNTWMTAILLLAEGGLLQCGWTATSNRRHGYHWHRLCVGGLAFEVWVGKLVPRAMRSLSLGGGTILLGHDVRSLAYWSYASSAELMGRLRSIGDPDSEGLIDELT